MSPSGRTTIAVGFHSGHGRTAAVAEAVACGAAGAGADVVVISMDTLRDEQWARWGDADAIIFGAAAYTDTAAAATRSPGSAAGAGSHLSGWRSSRRASPTPTPEAATNRPPCAVSSLGRSARHALDQPGPDAGLEFH